MQILYASESGNAEILAEDFQAEFEGEVDFSLASLDDVSIADLTSETPYLVICSTTGSGDVPGTAEAFLDSLKSTQPDLSGMSFVIFGLGDRTYADTFAQGSEKLMLALKSCGATMLGDRGIHDASGADLPEDVAFPWFRGLLSQL